MQNKLATIHFAETLDQLNAFATCDLSNYRDRYRDVIDMETIYISLKDYSVSDGLQKAEVEACVKLVTYNGSACSVSEENINMLFTKSAECKTQIVCGPSVLRCKGCGSFLSLVEGKKCSYCGESIDLEKHDWVIRKYNA